MFVYTCRSGEHENAIKFLVGTNYPLADTHKTHPLAHPFIHPASVNCESQTFVRRRRHSLFDQGDEEEQLSNRETEKCTLTVGVCTTIVDTRSYRYIQVVLVLRTSCESYVDDPPPRRQHRIFVFVCFQASLSLWLEVQRPPRLYTAAASCVLRSLQLHAMQCVSMDDIFVIGRLVHKPSSLTCCTDGGGACYYC